MVLRLLSVLWMLTGIGAYVGCFVCDTGWWAWPIGISGSLVFWAGLDYWRESRPEQVDR